MSFALTAFTRLRINYTHFRSYTTAASTGPKATSGADEHPRKHLISIYETLLSALSETSKFPTDAFYPMSLRKLFGQRLSFLGSPTLTDAEVLHKIDGGESFQDLIEQAKTEQRLMEQMSEWRAWEALEVEAPKGQWQD